MRIAPLPHLTISQGHLQAFLDQHREQTRNVEAASHLGFHPNGEVAATRRAETALRHNTCTFQTAYWGLLVEPQNSPPSPDLEFELRRTKLQRLYDAVFGYDFFISYAHKDGGPYAFELSKQLTQIGFICFLDSSDSVIGENWKTAGHRALRKTSRLVLIGTPAAMESKPVLREIQIFAKLNRRIIAIDMGGALAALNADAAPEVIKCLSPETLHIKETTKWSTDGPSATVTQELHSTFQLMRQRDKRTRWLTYAAISMLILAIVAVGTATYALFESAYAESKSQAATLAAEAEKRAKLNALKEAWEAKHHLSLNHIMGVAQKLNVETQRLAFFAIGRHIMTLPMVIR
jgi:hypothetical protein